MRPTDSGLLHLCAIALLYCLAGCNSFQPVEPAELPPFRQRALALESAHAGVEVVVLGADEARAVYGTGMESRDLQPVWVAVENRGDHPLWLLSGSLDEDYFSPLEAAWRCKGWLSSSTAARLEEHFESLAFENPIRPGERREGFVLTHVDRRVKWVEVDLWSVEGLESVQAFVDLPGTEMDFDRFEFASLHPPDGWQELETPERLRELVEAFPACTTDASGKREGDPLNFVLVAPAESPLAALVRRGWHPTEPVTVGSSLRTAGSFLFGTEYRYSPISPLHAFGRPQDLAAQKARGTIHQRNHLRLWQTPHTYGGRLVFLGQISRDVGVRTTTRTWSLTTHAIDPDVDETRMGLLEDLFYSGYLEAFGFTGGVHLSTRDDPHENLTGDVWYSDGLRLVLILGAERVEADEVEILPWLEHGPAADAGPPGLVP